MIRYRGRGIGSVARLLGVLAVALGLVASIGAPAIAAPGFNGTIPIEIVVRAPEGSLTQVASEDVPSEVVGQECQVSSIGTNRQSVHPGNDLLIESGDSQVVLPNVESVAGGTVTADGTLILGSTITVTLRMGPDEVFSAGFDVVVDCEPHPGRIVVVKEVTEGSDTSVAFDFTASYDGDGFSLSHGEQDDSGDLAPGVYSVSESPLDGWSLTSATCDDGSSVDAIDLSEGEVVTCTFVNEIVDVVGASIQVTVEGSCVTQGAEGDGVIDITMSVSEGATVVVRDDDGVVVGTFTSDGSITVPDGATYSWEATPSEGFEFPAGFESSGTITIESCSSPATLPFTGPGSDGLALLAATVLGSGVLILASTRKSEGS